MTSDLGMAASAIILVAVAGAFAAVDAALSRIPRVRADELIQVGRRGSRRLALVQADPAPYLNLVLLLRVAAELAAAVLITTVCLRYFTVTWHAVAVAIAAMTVIQYIAIGVAPRTLGRQHAERVGLIGAAILLPLARVLGPAPRLLILVGNALTPGKGFREGPFASEAELRELVDLAEKSQVIEDNERRMVHSVFELGDTIAREVMVPRTDMVYIERDKTLPQALSLALRSGFSRLPVVGKNEDDVVGVVYLKDLAKRIHELREGKSTEQVTEVMRPAAFTPDSKPVDELLREMQAQRIHLAVVLDEYGGTAGLITIEDILEEIVGEITDEYDQEVPPIESLPDGTVRITARLPVSELAELFGVDINHSDVDSVGGLLAQQLGRVPIPGSEAMVQGLSLIAESAAGRRNRIGTVLVRQVSPAKSVPPEDDANQAQEHNPADAEDHVDA